MGANAQTTVPTFTASQVLTADQQNQSARTGVPVFATTGTRDAAFGGTGEKTLAEGQLCYVEGTGLQTYNAAGAWVTWGAAPSTAGLTLISNTAHSAASSVSVDSVFSSTYTNYRMIWYSTFSTTLYPTMRLRASGTATTTNYSYQFASFAATSLVAGRATAQANLDNLGGSTAGPVLAVFDIYGINLAAPTTAQGQVTLLSTGNIGAVTYGWAQTANTQFDGVEINANTGNMTGNLWIYGYRKDI